MLIVKINICAAKVVTGEISYLPVFGEDVVLGTLSDVATCYDGSWNGCT